MAFSHTYSWTSSVIAAPMKLAASMEMTMPNRRQGRRIQMRMLLRKAYCSNQKYFWSLSGGTLGKKGLNMAQQGDADSQLAKPVGRTMPTKNTMRAVPLTQPA
jgi:hypothetical protein